MGNAWRHIPDDMPRVVLDTDVMVAALRSPNGASRAWLEAALHRRVALLLSVPLVLQYEEVLCRDEHLDACGATAADIARVLDAICLVGERVRISYLWRPMLRDPDDEMVLETAVNGRADWLLTFNARDFRGGERAGTRIMRPGSAWREWREEGA